VNSLGFGDGDLTRVFGGRCGRGRPVGGEVDDGVRCTVGDGYGLSCWVSARSQRKYGQIRRRDRRVLVNCAAKELVARIGSAIGRSVEIALAVPEQRRRGQDGVSGCVAEIVEDLFRPASAGLRNQFEEYAVGVERLAVGKLGPPWNVFPYRFPLESKMSPALGSTPSVPSLLKL
jgi:hypothetical protein